MHRWLLPSLVVVLACLASLSQAVSFCKCVCFERYEIVPLYRPTDPLKPCLTCTKQFCLDQQLDICKSASLGTLDPDVGTGEEGDVQARCFGALETRMLLRHFMCGPYTNMFRCSRTERESVMAKAAIISFLVLTAGLLLSAGIKDRSPELLQRIPILHHLLDSHSSYRPAPSSSSSSHNEHNNRWFSLGR